MIAVSSTTRFTSSVASNYPFPLYRSVSGRFIKPCCVGNTWQNDLFQSPGHNFIDVYRASENVSRVLSVILYCLTDLYLEVVFLATLSPFAVCGTCVAR